MSAVGERIKRARVRRGLSRPQLAERVGCSAEQIKRFEGLSADDKLPVGSRYFDRTLELLGLDLSGEPTGEHDPDNPRLTEATAKQLISALASLIWAESPDDEHDQSNVAPFEFRDVPLGDEVVRGDESGPA